MFSDSSTCSLEKSKWQNWKKVRVRTPVSQSLDLADEKVKVRGKDEKVRGYDDVKVR